MKKFITKITDKNIYAMMATDFEIKELARKIYAHNSLQSYKHYLEKSVKEGVA